MPAKTYTVGPGKLVFGPTGSAKEVSCQVSSCVVSWDVEQGDKTNLLCGETEFGASDYSATLKATLFQDLAEAGSFVAWTWANKGTVQPVEFVPSTAADKAITGSVVINPMDVGGDAKTKPTSDIEYAFQGEPVLGDATP